MAIQKPITIYPSRQELQERSGTKESIVSLKNQDEPHQKKYLPSEEFHFTQNKAILLPQFLLEEMRRQEKAGILDTD